MRKQSMKTWLSAGALLVMPFAANAAGLGKLTVTSALGQPLRGEIELVAVQKDDIGLVSVRVAPMDAFREAKIERPIALSSMHFSVEKRPNGDPYIKVTSTTPVNEPFLDLLIELNWPAGRLMREYTVLLDPPGFSETQAIAPVAMPITPAPLPATPAAPAAKAPETTATAPAVPVRKAVEKEPEKSAKEEKKTAAPQPKAETYGPVKQGETLAKIASQVRPDGVSLEQMLVGLYRDNPKAFTGNMNRMKTGQILRVPEVEKLAEITSKDAAREVKVQAADWHAYRQKLAAAVAEAAPEKAEPPPQAAVGKITPKVEDKAAKPAPSADVLKLSKGDTKEAKGMQDKIRALEEEATARGKTIKEANERIAQLEKSIKEMQRLVELKNQNLAELQKQAAKPQQPAPVAAKPIVPEVKPAPVPEVKPAEQKPAAKLEAPAKPKPEVAKPKPAVKPVVPAAEPAWYEGILSNPLYLGGGVVAVLLGGLLWLMVLGNRRRKNLTTFEDSIMTGGDLKANTVYGEATGGVIDTGDTSFLTDFSQAGLGNIDTNDVDPIAEAEVYMAYGRDAQAEEILKEAMAKDPNRHEIQLKLLEIYAGRKNTNAFEAMASELYAAIGGQPNQVWEKAADMGRQLDPSNPLYSAAVAGVMAKPAAEMMAVAEPVVPDLVDVPEIEEVAEDLSPDLEFGPEEETVSDEPVIEEPVMEVSDEEGALDFDLDLGSMESLEPSDELTESEPLVIAENEFGMDGVSLDTKTIIPQVIEKQAAQAVGSTEAALSFELPEAESAQTVEVSEFLPESEFVQAGEENTSKAEQIELEVPEFNEMDETPQEIIQSSSQEAPLDFDFQMDEETAEVPALTSTMASTAMPDLSLDMAGINLDMEESASMPETAPAVASTVAGESGTDSLWQEVSTKLDLAKAYVEMGDKEGAREILQEVLQEGDETQQGDAKALLAGIQ